ncbi:MAG: Nramp family divalent metal transporter [Saccharofermentans sp.]|jgi:NRAMP (natural resistance-associated macrophage protein)-like metal ion transporter|nr:Nramp family divalent metal transporter [Mageeibacillus sp.]MCI1263445.1 Nramp family divalent metal transporter [Saccharofermentans sp.]MCI1275736.1 Nramp family divalent metal transporter [Saccharofermentans sp.]MCI1769116.1 Nramp family divalent metal transporter [Mageeibacillus sp.]MCI2044072.1 Nramp family divalent metal transporter [Mageeibacillus sp.]
MTQTKRQNRLNFLKLISIVGPGIITVNAGNDAGGIATYASVGASYGYSMLWSLVIITLSLAVIQEMNARMAVVTGKGLSDLIRESFGVKWTFFAMVILLIANFGVVLGDFAGIAASMELFGVSKYVSVPVCAIIIWLLVTKGSYKRVEKIFLMFTFAFFGYIISAFLARPDWSKVGSSLISPSMSLDKGYILSLIGLIGTTITPYMQFYLQSSIVDKRLSVEDYKYEKLDVYLGAFWGDAVSLFIIVCTAATLYKAGISVDSAQQAAMALEPLAGRYAFILFGAGLFGASVLAASVIPLSTSYAVCEAFGWQSGVDCTMQEAPIFFGIYTFMVAFASALILIPGISLMKLILITQRLAGVLSPVILIFMIILVNRKDIMGKHVNNKLQNIISITTVAFISCLTLILIASYFRN